MGQRTVYIAVARRKTNRAIAVSDEDGRKGIGGAEDTERKKGVTCPLASISSCCNVSVYRVKYMAVGGEVSTRLASKTAHRFDVHARCGSNLGLAGGL